MNHRLWLAALALGLAPQAATAQESAGEQPLADVGEAIAEAEAAPAEPEAAPAAEPPRDPSQPPPPANPADVRSLDAIVAALYATISGDKGVERDWNRLRSLFHPGGRMIPTGRNSRTGKIGGRIASVEEYIAANEGFLEGEGFHELELYRHVDEYGTIAQVFSVYEARHALSDAKPFLRGINSIQLLNDGERWHILSIAWSPETKDNPLPEKYPKKVQR